MADSPAHCCWASADHLAMYGEADISLDTFPYAGTTTTCESLYMGVPCVTLAGACHAHNVGVSLMTAVGVAQSWIARTQEEYVTMALNAAKDLGKLSKLRHQLRQQMLKSRLCDAEAFVTDLEQCYKGVWQQWCKQHASSCCQNDVESDSGIYAANKCGHLQSVGVSLGHGTNASAVHSQ